MTGVLQAIDRPITKERYTNMLNEAHQPILNKTYPQILNVGVANPPRRYKQSEVVNLFGDLPLKIQALFKNSHIKYRHLYLPDIDENGKIPEETNQELIDKHLKGALELGPQAINKCLLPYDLEVKDIDHLICVSSTGFLCPGVSAYIAKQMGFRDNVHRVDILGMGCNAGINSLQCAVGLTRADPDKKVLLVCLEICSAAYCFDGTIKTGIVNSLFGDGVAAVLVGRNREGNGERGRGGCWPSIVGFESRTITDKIDLMRYELINNKLSFYIAKETPYVIGQNINKPVNGLLKKYGLKKRDISHWVVHSGGKKVLDSIKYNLGLSSYDIRHTTKILEEYGNLSSCSVFFSLQRLQEEGVAMRGDLGISIAMGPGTALETALLRW